MEAVGFWKQWDGSSGMSGMEQWDVNSDGSSGMEAVGWKQWDVNSGMETVGWNSGMEAVGCKQWDGSSGM